MFFYITMDWIKISLSFEQLEEIKNAERQIDNKQLLKRLQCLKLKNKKWTHTEISEFIDTSVHSISEWLKTYKQGGLRKLLQWNYKGKESILTQEDQEKIKARNKEKPFNTAKEAKDFIKKEFGVHWHLHWVQKLLKKNFNFRTNSPD